MEIGELFDELYLLENDSIEKRQYACHQLINGEQIVNETLFNLLKQFGKTEDKKILDAGSGYGGSIQYLISKLKNCQFTGCTLSQTQYNISKELLQHYPNSAVLFQDYSQLNTYFDVIYGIESINFSKNLYLTLSNWHSSLTDDGIVILIDDFLIKFDQVNKIEAFKNNWLLASLHTLEKFIEIAYSSGLLLADSTCLSAKYRNHFENKGRINNPSHPTLIGSNIRNRLYEDSILGYYALVFVKKSDYQNKEQQIVDAFSSIYNERGLNYLRDSSTYDVFCDVLKPEKSSKILDIGCGAGLLSQSLKGYFYNLGNYTGIDISPEAIELAKQQESSASFFCKSIHDIPFDWNNYFDYVVVLGVFERMYYKNACFLHIRRVLKDNGKCLIMVRNSESKWWQEQYPRWEPKNSKEGAYSLDDFKAMIVANLFEVERIYPDLIYFSEKTDFEKVKTLSKEIIFIIRKSNISTHSSRSFINHISYTLLKYTRKIVHLFSRIMKKLKTLIDKI